ncbi:hypothetical protein [Streptomyces glaucescens]|jgi:hypothetical protein|nr:hypothetical protein [Streptomyces glaucescens]
MNLRHHCTALAACYIGLVTAGATAYGAAQADGGWAGEVLHTAVFPGYAIFVVLVIYPIMWLSGAEWNMSDETVHPLSHVPPFVAGAVVNALLAWGMTRFLRHFRRESRRSGGSR